MSWPLVLLILVLILLALTDVHAGRLCVATVLFDIPLHTQTDDTPTMATTTLPRSGFISYSSWDLPRVLPRVHGIQAAPMEVFMDVFRLRSGDRWQDEIFRQIDQCDVLYLFWSYHAARSQWVEREWRRALEQKGIGTIRPMPLADPRRVTPPPELGDMLHFDDWIRRYENDVRGVGLLRRLQTWMYRR